MPRSRARQEVSAGGVVFRMEDGRPLFLLIRDSYDNWGFPKGHVERDEAPERTAVREVEEETGLHDLELRDAIDTIDWYFRFRKRLIHKVCHFYLMESAHAETCPQREEGITECNWLPLSEALERISYANARGVLERAAGMVEGRKGSREQKAESGNGS
ncbi:MAG TPA: NUDIX hydrolase [Gemmatimonadaceae bacterium]|nr:NUDIX hydrolase [Gemmatimonadaceae bacterium]